MFKLFATLVAIALVLILAVNTAFGCDDKEGQMFDRIDSENSGLRHQKYGRKAIVRNQLKLSDSMMAKMAAAAAEMGESNQDNNNECKSSANNSICSFQNKCGRYINDYNRKEQIHVGIELRGNRDDHYAYDKRCSGTMVTDKLVLTSRHCTYFSDDSPVSPASINIDLGPFNEGHRGLKRMAKVSRICRHKDVSHSNVFKQKQLALLELSESVDQLKVSCWPFKGLGVGEGEIIRNHCVAIGVFDRIRGLIWERSVREENGFSCHLTYEKRLKSSNRCWHKYGKGGSPSKYPGAPIVCLDANNNMVVVGVVAQTAFVSDNREQWMSEAEAEAEAEAGKQSFIRYPFLATMIDPIKDADLANYECTS